MGGQGYPVPVRHRWYVMVDLPDGNVIMGTSDDDLMDRWGRMLGWLQGQPLSAAEARVAIARYLDVFYQQPLDIDAENATNSDFLDAAAATGVIKLIRK